MIIFLVLSIALNILLAWVIRHNHLRYLAAEKMHAEHAKQWAKDFEEATGMPISFWWMKKTSQYFAQNPRSNVKITGIQP